MNDLVEQHARKRRMEERAFRLHDCLYRYFHEAGVEPMDEKLDEETRALLKEIDGE